MWSVKGAGEKKKRDTINDSKISGHPKKVCFVVQYWIEKALGAPAAKSDVEIRHVLFPARPKAAIDETVQD